MAENIVDINVVARKELSGICTAFLLRQDIIEVEWDIDLIEIQKHHLVQLKEIIKELGKGKKMRVYISTNALMHSTTDAREFAASDEGQEFTLANAILVNSIAKRILFNFYVNINKPKTPIKGFNNREEALAWLQKLK